MKMSLHLLAHVSSRTGIVRGCAPAISNEEALDVDFLQLYSCQQ